MPKSREQVIEALSSYRDRMEDLLSAISEGSTAVRTNRQRLQELLRSLKGDLREDAKQCGLVRNQAALSEYERNYFCPAVTEASAHLRVAVNTDPIQSRWIDDIYEAKVDITHLLTQLEEENS